MTGRILVGVDGSAGSRRALAWAVEEAAVRSWAVEAVIVWQSPYDLPGDVDFSYPVDEDKLAERARARVTEAVGEVARAHPEVEIQPVVLEGDPAETLCRRAAADLLVVGSRGHGIFVGLLLGSVGSKCAHHSRCPVVIVPASRRGDKAQRLWPTGRILVGVDGSPGSRRALRWAADEAGARGATVVALMVWRGSGADDDASEQAVPPSPARRDRLTAEIGREHLEQVVAEVLGETVVVVEPIVLEGDPAEILCQRATEADLLVVGSRGHGSFAELSLGSVSAKCARHCPRPVVIVPTDRDVQASIHQTQA